MKGRKRQKLAKGGGAVAKTDPQSTAWLCKACTLGRHSECNGKLVMVPGPCECSCHPVEEKPK